MTVRTLVPLLALAVTAASASAQTPQKPAAQTPTTPTQVSPQQAQTLNLSVYAELLRADVQSQKIAILTQVMGFTEAEDKAFWPIYRAYSDEMAKLGDERVALVGEYARAYSTITDDIAQQLMTRAIALDTRRRAALEKCANDVRAALSSKTALKFLQVEHQLLLIIDLQIASSLPVVQ